MARCAITIGYSVTEEIEPGIYSPNNITEKTYIADVVNNFNANYVSQDKINSDIKFSQTVSVLADPYAIENLGNMIYVKHLGLKLSIVSISFVHPRVQITLGGVYNG